MKFKDDLIIIRHARSQHNVGESTDLDCGITEFGETQSTNVGRYLNEMLNIHEQKPPFRYYTSPFLRCLETSQRIQSQLPGINFQVMPQLREYLNHSISHHNPRELFVPKRASQFPNIYWDAFEGETFHDEFNEIFLHRMEECHALLADRSVVVTHGLPGFCLLYVATTSNPRHVPVWDYSLDNCSITWIKRGRVIWHGKNLYHEMKNDRPWPNDSCVRDLLVKQ